MGAQPSVGATCPELAAFLAEKTAAGLRPRSVDWYRERLAPVLAAIGPRPRKGDLLEWLLGWRRERRPSQAHYRGMLVAVRAYLRWQGHALNIPMPRVPRFEGQRLSGDEIKRLLECCHENQRLRWDARDYAMLALMVDTGLRASEVVELRWGDVDMEARHLAVAGKGGHRRLAYFGEMTRDALQTWRECHPRGGAAGCVFVGKKGIFTRNGIFQMVRKRGQQIGIRLGPHMLRRTFATQWIRGGGGAFVLQRLLGHTSFEMTRRYVLLAESDDSREARAHGVLDILFAPAPAGGGA